MKLMASLRIRKIYAALSVAIFSILTGVAFAADGDMGEMADRLAISVSDLRPVIGGIGYLIGLVFLILGIMHFKKHKDSPQQTALSIPIALVAIGTSLVFLPTLISSTGTTLFGADKHVVSANGYLDPNTLN